MRKASFRAMLPAAAAIALAVLAVPAGAATDTVVTGLDNPRLHPLREGGSRR
jgi:hypothetical protein